jgi:outer membrane protein assembly factor BamA
MNPKNRHLDIWKSVLLLLCFCVFSMLVMAQHQLKVNLIDKDSSFNRQSLKLQTSFVDAVSCAVYINSLPALLSSKGYPTASIDSFWVIDKITTVNLFLGKQYHWIKLLPDNAIEKKAMDESGFIEKNFNGKVINISQLQQVQQRILNYYEKNGRPFAEIFLDSVRLDEDKIDAVLKVKPGPVYRIDSLRILGKAKVSANFMEHYLGIPKGSLYNKEKLQQVSGRLLELPYLQEVQPNDITMLGSGAILNLYLAPKRSSQFNFLIGFLPSGTDANKLQITGDVNLDLKNALGTGETILANWQQLQPKSPRLNLGYQQPYIFHSNFGFDFAFDLFKKDSSFLQLNGQLGLQYILSANQSGKLFVQWQNSFLLAEGVDTNQVIATKQLPPNIDVNAINVGLDYDWSKTDYKLNPRSGNEVRIITSVGIKKVKPNNAILDIKDPSFNYASLYDSVKPKSYQFRFKLSAAHYFPLGKQATFKTALNGGLYTSPSIFRNELFQIGGYKLLRGFNEESIYATQYAVVTAEYRYRLGLNSNLFYFVDGGWARNKYQSVNVKNTFIGTGIGMLFETKFGLLNISYAVGKRDDVKFNLRESSKIHFGYINYF